MLKSITCINIQGHKYTFIEFPRTGVVRIHGPNSAGKTALFKPLFDIMENNILVPSDRKDLINSDSKEKAAQYIIETWDGHEFILNINEEASKTSYILKRPSGERVERYMSDRVMGNLFSSLGFHWDAKREVSLNIFHKDSPKLIVNTSPAFNGDLLKTATADIDAENTQVNLTNLLKEIRSMRDNVKMEKSRLTAVYGSLEFDINIDFEEERLKRLKALKAVLSLMNLEVEDIPIVAPSPLNKPLLYLPSVEDIAISAPPTYNRTMVSLPSVEMIELDFDSVSKFEAAAKAKICPLCETPVKEDKCGKLGEYLASR